MHEWDDHVGQSEVMLEIFSAVSRFILASLVSISASFSFFHVVTRVARV